VFQFLHPRALFLTVLFSFSVPRADAALIYYTSSLPSSVFAGASLKFGQITYPLNGSYTFGSSTGTRFGIQPEADGMRAVNAVNGLEWAADAGIVGSSYLGTGNIIKFGSFNSISAGSSSNWTSASSGVGFAEDGRAGNWNAGGRGVAGIRYFTGSGYHYGWVELIYNAAADSVTVDRFAFESVINAAAITPNVAPEPGQVASSFLLLAGITGYVVLKRRQKRSVAKVV
jgi:hypothetical protein